MIPVSSSALNTTSATDATTVVDLAEVDVDGDEALLAR